MLADEYGYQVSRGTAATYPGVYERLRREKNLARNCLLFAVVMVAVAVAAVQWLVPVSLDAGVVAATAAGTLALFFGLGGAIGLAVTGSKLALARSHPFQAWPCQLEETKDHQRLILLLAPDGSVARELDSAVPDTVWRGTSDGRGVLWIAGDLRSQCLVSTPEAKELWRAKGRPYGASPVAGGGRLRAVEDELLRSATQEAFSAWMQ
ncbi:hypothetical protein [Streptomyces milbemycinicus]|uniref:Integral membrane protein n=1 Tax=Streptomyces milbemycinicus TaxID=476552 RepID=A0ABW8M2E8_9ACTN